MHSIAVLEQIIWFKMSQRCVPKINQDIKR